MTTPALTAADHHDDAPQPATRWARRGTGRHRHRRNLVTATAIALAITGILGLVVATAPSELGPRPLQNTANRRNLTARRPRLLRTVST